jgi:hypothetical protein
VLCSLTPRFALGLEPPPENCPPDPVCTLELSDNFATCNGCHALDPAANAQFGIDKPGFFGSNGTYSSDGVVHIMKVPHFRNMYQKVGMFGTVQTPVGIGLSDLPDSPFGPREGGLFALQNAFTGRQLRGFGYTHAGEEDTIFHFTASIAFIKSLGFGAPPFLGDNLGGFELFLPRDRAACFDGALPALNADFVAALAPPDVLEALRAELRALADPGSTPERLGAATAALEAFVAGLPPDNPGQVFASVGAAQLVLPLLGCPALPDSATLEARGCFELGAAPECADLFGSVRSCALWGRTLEQLLGTGNACRAEGLETREAVEDFIFAFDSNLKPVVGQQVTLRNTQPGGAQSGDGAAQRRLALLLDQAALGHNDVVAHCGSRGAVYENGEFLRDDGVRASLASLLAGGASVTFTAVPPGEGRRSGVDRDLNGTLDALQH